MTSNQNRQREAPSFPLLLFFTLPTYHNPWRDLAGHLLKFTNPDAKATDGTGISAYLRDALSGLDSAEEEALATPQWRHQTRLKVIDVLAQTDDLLREVRVVLAEKDDDTGIF